MLFHPTFEAKSIEQHHPTVNERAHSVHILFASPQGIHYTFYGLGHRPGEGYREVVDNMQREVIPRRVDFEEAVELSNWHGIQMDLEFVCDACQRLLDTVEDDSVLRRALFVAALVAYARCFKGNEGVRVGLDENVLEGMGEDNVLGLHRFFIALRDKHIAHSVSPFEQGDVGVAELGGRLVVVDLTQLMIGVPAKSVGELKEMAEFLINVVAKNAAIANDNVIAKYQGLTSDQVLALPLMGLKTPNPSEVGQAREGLKLRQRRGGVIGS